MVSPRCTKLATDDDKASLMYARLEFIKRATDLRQKADKSLSLAQRRYKKDYESLVRFAPIFRVGDYVFLVRPTIFRSAAERFASEEKSKLLTLKRGP